MELTSVAFDLVLTSVLVTLLIHTMSNSLLELKAITAEHADRIAKEGKAAVKGQQRREEKA